MLNSASLFLFGERLPRRPFLALGCLICRLQFSIKQSTVGGEGEIRWTTETQSKVSCVGFWKPYDASFERKE